jgi:hypothetical protein
MKWERHLLHSKERNPEGWKPLGRLSALLARARPLRVLPLRSRLEIRPNGFQQMPFPFNQWSQIMEGG